jgi:spermidine synthase
MEDSKISEKSHENGWIGSKLSLEAIAFLVGAAVLVLEIAGGRLLAPAFGSSIFVWTAQICTVLVALAAGYMYGGRMADKGDDYAKLSKMLILACATLAIALLISDYILLFGFLSGPKFGSFLMSIMIFFLPCFFSGAVTPLLLRIYVASFQSVGNDAGRLYAISTLGSLIGALLSAYFIVPFMGAKLGVFLTALLFGVLAFAVKGKINLNFAIILVVLAGTGYAITIPSHVLISDKFNIIAELDSEYHGIRIAENSTHRVLLMDSDAHSEIEKGSYEPVFVYVKEMVFATDKFLKGKGNGQKIGLLGLGAGSLADYYASKGYDFDAYEIDPKVYEIAQQYFNLTTSPSLKVHIGDGRLMLSQQKPKYDVLLIDAFSSELSIPVHLATKEAVKIYADSIAPGGIAVMNIISSLDGPKGTVFQSISQTMREDFPYQAAIYNENRTEKQNIILIVSKTPFAPGYVDLLKEKWNVTESWGPGKIYTDDKSSLDYDMMQVIG